MATQQQVNDLQSALLSAEAAVKAANNNVMDAINVEGGISAELKAAALVCKRAARRAQVAFHKVAVVCAIGSGVTPQSGGGPKTDINDED